jgi:uncharacterized protein DUF6220
VQALRAVYRVGTIIVAAMVVIQIGAAGFGAFNASEHISDTHPLTDHTFDDGFSFHRSFGYVIFIAAVVLLILAIAARLGRRRIIQVGVLALMVAVQIFLAGWAEDTHWVGPFHALLAFAILGLAGRLVYEAWRGPAPAVST